MPICIRKLYQLLAPPGAQETKVLLIHNPDAARDRACQMGLPDSIGNMIHRELAAQQSDGDREDFEIGVSILSVELAIEAGQESRSHGDDGVCPFATISFAPKVAEAIVEDAEIGAALAASLADAIEKARSKPRRLRPGA